jgi:hypothetical protein
MEDEDGGSSMAPRFVPDTLRVRVWISYQRKNRVSVLLTFQFDLNQTQSPPSKCRRKT